MKKILIVTIALMATLSADWIVGGKLGYGNIDGKVGIDSATGSAGTKYTSYGVRAGYAFEHLRVLGYTNTDSYKNAMLSATEGNAISYGIDADYTFNVSEKYGVILGVSYGIGNKDLGSSGSAVGISSASYTDKAFRGGIVTSVSMFELEIGLEKKMRDYNNKTYAGYVISADDDLLGLYTALNFRF